MITKSTLAIQLSKLKLFASPNIIAEQYPTDSEIAAEILWNAYMNGDVSGKLIADLGCGTGILGIACLLMDAKKVWFVDKDNKALAIAAENLAALNAKSKHYEMLCSDVSSVKLKADVVIMNPPFGTKTKHADREFLSKAFSIAKVVYSIHKTATLDFLFKIGEDNGFKITNAYRFNFPIKRTHKFHKRKIYRIETACLRFES